MFIIWGWGRKTRKVIGDVSVRTCLRCGTEAVWELCIIRTWFTIFFIPVFPCSKTYCISCPKCRSYMEISREQFKQLQDQIISGAAREKVNEELKYCGKTETQINYLKQMKEISRSDTAPFSGGTGHKD